MKTHYSSINFFTRAILFIGFILFQHFQTNAQCNSTFMHFDSLCNVHFIANGAAGYSWNYGDGTTGFGQSTYHTYSNSGSYFVRLYAYNSQQNLCDSTGHWIYVNCGPPPPPCNAHFIHFDSSCNVHYIASGAAGYSWDFGDGSNGTGQSVYHTYSTSGNYFVKLYHNSSRCEYICRL